MVQKLPAKSWRVLAKCAAGWKRAALRLTTQVSRCGAKVDPGVPRHALHHHVHLLVDELKGAPHPGIMHQQCAVEPGAGGHRLPRVKNTGIL